jgi:surfactin synthase thioesterase subunit
MLDEEGSRDDAQRWFVRRSPRPNAPVQVVCLPNAGSGASAFQGWPSAFGDRAEILAVQPPGRASRLAEPTIADIEVLARRLAVALTAVVDRPLVLFGHSMGALVAFETSRVLADQDSLPVQQVVLSAARPPGSFAMGSTPVPNDPAALLAHLRRLGGTPSELLDDPEAMAFLLPSIHADLQAVDAYRPPQSARLEVPVRLVAGARDTHAPPAVVRDWDRWIPSGAPLYVLPGAHFYLQDAQNLAVLVGIVLREENLVSV